MAVIFENQMTNFASTPPVVGTGIKKLTFVCDPPGGARLCIMQRQNGTSHPYQPKILNEYLEKNYLDKSNTFNIDLTDLQYYYDFQIVNSSNIPGSSKPKGYLYESEDPEE